jgi:hypothetical protein
LALIAEQHSKIEEPGSSPDQSVPIVVAHLMSKVAENGAVGFPHLIADSLPRRIVRFFNVKGDDAVIMAGHHSRPALRRPKEIEC